MRVFLAALDLPASERPRFVDRECDDNAELRDRVEGLLRAGEDPTDPVAGMARPAEGAGIELGDFALREELGHGGMGVVWLAEQKSLKRPVALKLVRPSLATPELLRRLEREAAILGRLHHPGIASVYAVGSAPLGAGGIAGRQHFFAMEYVEGDPLDVHADQRELDHRERIELLAEVCDAVEHAHQRGVIHRDLKPDNIHVSANGRPKVLDFGIARATSSDVMTMTMHTAVGQVVGTVPYMSPEQVLGDPAGIDARSDVYSLGVLLYRLLSGRLPADVTGRSIPEAARIIRDDEPTRLGTIATTCRGDVETIVHKALEKDPQRRYQSAGALAADLRRYLRSEPIVARPTTAFYQLRKFARRHKGVVLGLAATFVVLVTGVAVSSVLAVEASRSATAFERETYGHHLMIAASALRENDVALADASLREAPVHLRGWEWRHLESRLDMSLGALPLPPGAAWTASLPWFSDDDSVVSVWVLYLDPQEPLRGQARVESWRLPDGEPLAPGPAVELDAEELDSGGLHATPGLVRRDGEWLEWYAPGAVEPLRIPWAELAPPGANRSNFRFTPTGSHVAWSVASRPGVPSAAETWLAGIRDGNLVNPRQVLPGIAMFIAADGGRVASFADDSGRLPLWSESGGTMTLVGHKNMAAVLATADGTLLSSHSHDGTLRTWNGVTGAPIAVSHALGTHVNSHVLRSDGKMLVSGSNDGLLRVWEAPELRVRATLRGHRTKTPIVGALSHDGKLVTSVTFQTSEFVRVWDTSVDADPWVLRGHESYVYALDVSPDGSRIASGSWDDTVRLWDARTLRPTATLTGHRDWIGAVAFSPDGGRVAAVGVGRRLLVWDVETGALLADAPDYGLHEELPITWHPDGQRLLFGLDDREPRILDLRSGRVETVPFEFLRELRSGVASPDGSRYVVTNHREEPVRYLELRDSGSGVELNRVRVDATGCKFAFTPPGVEPPRLLVAFSERLRSSEHSGWCLLDPTTGAELAHEVVGRSRTLAVAFSPDGTRFVTGGYDRSIGVWDAARLEPLVRLSGHTDYVYRLAYDPTGERLYSASGDGTVRVWGTQPLRELLRARTGL